MQKGEVIPGESPQQVDASSEFGSSAFRNDSRCKTRATPTQTSCSGTAARVRADGSATAHPDCCMSV